MAVVAVRVLNVLTLFSSRASGDVTLQTAAALRAVGSEAESKVSTGAAIFGSAIACKQQEPCVHQLGRLRTSLA